MKCLSGPLHRPVEEALRREWLELLRADPPVLVKAHFDVAAREIPPAEVSTTGPACRVVIRGHMAAGLPVWPPGRSPGERRPGWTPRTRRGTAACSCS